MKMYIEQELLSINFKSVNVHTKIGGFFTRYISVNLGAQSHQCDNASISIFDVKQWRIQDFPQGGGMDSGTFCRKCMRKRKNWVP